MRQGGMSFAMATRRLRRRDRHRRTTDIPDPGLRSRARSRRRWPDSSSRSSGLSQHQSRPPAWAPEPEPTQPSAPWRWLRRCRLGLRRGSSRPPGRPLLAGRRGLLFPRAPGGCRRNPLLLQLVLHLRHDLLDPLVELVLHVRPRLGDGLVELVLHVRPRLGDGLVDLALYVDRCGRRRLGGGWLFRVRGTRTASRETEEYSEQASADGCLPPRPEGWLGGREVTGVLVERGSREAQTSGVQIR